MALTQPILNPIPAFDATKDYVLSFVVIGGNQVVANRLVIQNNETGEEVYSNIESTLRLEHTIPANTLVNGGYYNAVIQTLDNANTLSSPSTPVPFYCYSQPVLSITNIPTSETIENGTYTFNGSFSQAEGEILNSYQYTLYNSNREILSQTPLIYYETDPSLSYTFVGMSNDTAYYIELSGQTVNNTIVTSGLIYFTVRYIQPASFAICDLVNDCADGYIQISSNIVAIDGHSNPDPPIYIDDKEVDLTGSNAWVEWNSGFRIQDDFTMRVWGRDFNPYSPIVTLTNEINTEETPNKIELKWMQGDVIKELPEYKNVKNKLINVMDAQVSEIKNVEIYGNSVQKSNDTAPITPSPDIPSEVMSLGDIKNLVNIPNFNISYSQEYFEATKLDFVLRPNYTYTLSFNFNINMSSTDVYYSIGYGTTTYETDLVEATQYVNQSNGRNSATFTVTDNIPDNSYLWIKFGQTIILADINVDISEVQLENGRIATKYQPITDYNIYPTSTSKNMFDYNNTLYLNNVNSEYTTIANGYSINPISVGDDAYLAIGFNNILNKNDTYTISYSQLGQFEYFKLYATLKGSQDIEFEIPLNNNAFIAPDEFYDLQLVFGVDSTSVTNYIEIWNIQLEANNIITTYEPYISNSSLIVLDEPLRGIGTSRDLICKVSPNLLDANSLLANVKENTKYYISQNGTVEYNISFINEGGNIISTINITSGVITTPENCAQIRFENVLTEDLVSNHVQINIGEQEESYYPYILKPSLIRKINKIVLDGSDDESLIENSVSKGLFQVTLENVSNNLTNINVMCDCLIGAKGIDIVSANAVNNSISTYNSNRMFIRMNDYANNLAGLKAWLQQNPITVYYALEEPIVIPLSNNNIEALNQLSSYNPITNIFTNNNIQGIMNVDYVNKYSLQETQNAYILLKCWNGNTMPYVIHSNYIDIPESTENVFIWMRRKKNIFDLIIENLAKGD